MGRNVLVHLDKNYEVLYFVGIYVSGGKVVSEISANIIFRPKFWKWGDYVGISIHQVKCVRISFVLTSLNSMKVFSVDIASEYRLAEVNIHIVHFY